MSIMNLSSLCMIQYLLLCCLLYNYLGVVSIVFFFVFCCVVFLLIISNFFIGINWFNIICQSVLLLIVVMVMILVIIIGGIDLLVGFILVLVGVFFVIVLNSWGLLWLVVFFGGLLLGGFVGVINGFFIVYEGILVFIVMFVILVVVCGIVLLVIQGYLILVLVDSLFIFIGCVWVVGIFMFVLFGILILLIGYIVFNYMCFGCYVIVIGVNVEGVWCSGINIKVVIMKVYIISGMVVVLVGMIIIVCFGSGFFNQGEGFELQVIVVVVLGSISLFGGFGIIIGMLLGVLLIVVIQNGLILLYILLFYIQIVIGIIILLVIWLNICIFNLMCFVVKGQLMKGLIFCYFFLLLVGVSSGYVMIVFGLLLINEMGVILMYEYILLDVFGKWVLFCCCSDCYFVEMLVKMENFGELLFNLLMSCDNCQLFDVDVVIDELIKYCVFGGEMVVDLINIGIGCDLKVLVCIVWLIGLNIIMGIGFYLEFLYFEWVKISSVEQLIEWLIYDFGGVEEKLEVFVGFIGEIGIFSCFMLDEEKFLCVVGWVSVVIGVLIEVYLFGWEWLGYWVLDIFEQEGVDLCYIVLCYMNFSFVDKCYQCELVQCGVFFEYDMIGMSYYYVDELVQLFFDEENVCVICELIDDGYIQ